MSYLNKTPLEDEGSFQNMSKISSKEQVQKNQGPQQVSVISQQIYSANNRKDNTIDEIEQFNNELLDDQYKGNSMLNNLLEESKVEDANQLAGSSYRNESEEFNLKNDDFNYLSQLRAIDEFKLQLNNFEVL